MHHRPNFGSPPVPHGKGYNFNRDDLFSILRDWFRKIQQSSNSNSELGNFLGKFQRREPWGFRKDLLKMCHFSLWIILSKDNRDPTTSREITSPPLPNYLQGIKLGGFHRKKKVIPEFYLGGPVCMSGQTSNCPISTLFYIVL